MQTQVLSGRVLSLYLAVTNYQDSNTPCNHSKTIKTKREKLHKFIMLISTESKARKYK